MKLEELKEKKEKLNVDEETKEWMDEAIKMIDKLQRENFGLNTTIRNMNRRYRMWQKSL